MKTVSVRLLFMENPSKIVCDKINVNGKLCSFINTDSIVCKQYR